jgi:hypothetical protein
VGLKESVMAFQVSLLLASCLMLSLCRPSQVHAGAPAPLHYQISASIAPGTGVLTSDVTITIPLAEVATTDTFILGKRFELQPVEAQPHASIQIEATDKPVTELQKIRVHYDVGAGLRTTEPRRALWQGPLLLMELEQTVGRQQLDSVLAQLGRHPPRKTREFLDVLGRVAGTEAARDFEAKLRAE